MRAIRSLAWRSLTARALRTGLSVLGVGIGVGVLFVALVANAGIDTAIGATVRSTLGRADLRVGAFEERGLGAASLEAIRSAPGVALAAPAIERRTYLTGRPGGPDQSPVRVLGVVWAVEAALHDLPLAEGTGLADGPARGQASPAIVSADLAREAGLRLGDSIELLGAGSPLTVVIVGILAADAVPSGPPARVVVIRLEDAGVLFELSGVTRVDVQLAPGSSPTEIIQTLEDRLTGEPYVLGTAAEQSAALRSSMADLRVSLVIVVAVALFSSAFMIFNTLSMGVAERVREIGLLRLAGASRRQINVLVLAQATLIGLAGTAIGIGFGLAVRAAATLFLTPIGQLGSTSPEIVQSSALAAGLLGLTVIVAAALEPAIRAGRIAPVEVLGSRAERVSGYPARLRWLIAVFLVVAIGGYLLVPVPIDRLTDLPRPLLVYAILLVATLAVPLTIRPLGRLAGVLLRAVLPLEERLARGSLRRDRGRTALTVGVLLIGVAMIVAADAVALRTRTIARAWITGVVPGSDVLRSIRPVGLDEGVVEEIGSMRGVARASPIGLFAVAHEGIALEAGAINGADFEADGRLDFVDGERAVALAALDAGGAVILPRRLAVRLGLELGDELGLASTQGIVGLRVVGLVERGFPGASGQTLLVGWSDALERFGVLGADLFAVRYEPGQELVARSGVEDAARTLALVPQRVEDLEGAVNSALGRLVGLFEELALITLVVAGLGIVNTLSMSVLERVREIGVLRATGMTRPQVWRMVLVEAAVLGAAGASLGALAGLLVGLVLLGDPGGRAEPGTVQLPTGSILLASVFAMAVALLAAAYPARLASRVPIVRAVQFE